MVGTFFGLTGVVFIPARNVLSEIQSPEPKDSTLRSCDVLIARRRFAGLALADRAETGVGNSFKCAVADPALANSEGGDVRASAIAAAARRLFETHRRLGKDRGRRAADPRHGGHQYQGRGRPASDLSHLRRRDRRRASRSRNDRECGAVEGAAHKAQGVGCRAFAPTAVDRLRSTSRRLRDVHFAGGDALWRSFLSRPMARAPPFARRAGSRHGWDYDQAGIVTTVAHERDHQRPRRGAFPAGGTVRDPAAERQALLDRMDRDNARPRASSRCRIEEFRAELEKRFGLKLGDIEVAGPRAPIR